MNSSTRNKTLYFNTAACGLISEKVINAAQLFYSQLTQNSSEVAEKWRQYNYPEIKQDLANFLDAKETNIALIPNFSFGLNAVITALQGTEKVLLFRQDYPSLIEPFLINQFEIEWIDSKDDFIIDMAELERIFQTGHIDILAISHIQWLSGFKLDLKELGHLCKQHGVYLIVDGTQSVGAHTISLANLGIDVFIFSNYKWMNAGFGTGVLYIQDSFMEKFPPKIGGYQSYILKDHTFLYEPSIKSYEPGHLNLFGFDILQNAIKEKNVCGVSKIQDHNFALTKLFLERIQNMPVELIGPYTLENRSSILFLKDKNGLAEKLKEKGVVFTNRNGHIRLSFHVQNTKEEILQLLENLYSFGSY